MLVSAAFVRRYLGEVPALGQLIGRGEYLAPIVGVVEDVVERGLDGEIAPVIYSTFDGSSLFSVTYLVRTSNGSTPEEIAQVVRRSSRDVVVQRAATLGQRLDDTVREKTFATMVAFLFAFAAIAVTTVGVVGVVSFLGITRRKELAIHLALGATSTRLRWLVASESVIASLYGGVVGVLIGRWISTYLSSLTYGVEVGSWTAALTAGAAVLAILIAASLLQSRSMTHVHPSESLKST